MQQTSSPRVVANRSISKRLRVAWLFCSLAFQNLLRRPTRTCMLIVAVGLGTGAVFASLCVMRGIQASMDQSFARMGADLIVVPKDAMLNITSALLTVQPTDATMDANLVSDIQKLDGVDQVATQTIYHVPFMAGMPEHQINLIAYNPANDFTVTPWIVQHLPRDTAVGDLISGGRRSEAVGEEVGPCGVPSPVYGKLGISGVGPFDDSLFATYASVEKILTDKKMTGPTYNPGKISALLVRLKFGATQEQIRFAIAQIPGIKVISGTRIVTSTRQTIAALMEGMAGFSLLMLFAAFILISLLFSAIISERKREIGLLRAIGCKSANVVGMLIAEAAFTTGLGGVFGILTGCALLLIFQRSLVYCLTNMQVEFIWPAVTEMVATGIACALLAAFGGLVGAIIPAWKASKQEPHLLIQGEGI